MSRSHPLIEDCNSLRAAVISAPNSCGSSVANWVHERSVEGLVEVAEPPGVDDETPSTRGFGWWAPGDSNPEPAD